MHNTGDGRIPVLVVSGFLGSGKTTLVRASSAVCSGKRARGWRSSPNEFGALGIDQALLGDGGEAFVELEGGLCLLSTVRRIARHPGNAAQTRAAGSGYCGNLRRGAAFRYPAAILARACKRLGGGRRGGGRGECRAARRRPRSARHLRGSGVVGGPFAAQQGGSGGPRMALAVWTPCWARWRPIRRFCTPVMAR